MRVESSLFVLNVVIIIHPSILGPVLWKGGGQVGATDTGQALASSRLSPASQNYNQRSGWAVHSAHVLYLVAICPDTPRKLFTPEQGD